ncbi:MAG: hypothetical protein SH847_13475, partial [Roseiflexaceae bacterium]|nr:hypothetical protein [Roseiflexaceae bacterium]
MASVTLPTKRATGGNRRIFIGIGVIIIAIIAALILTRPQSASTQTTSTTTSVASGNIVASVDGNGTVTAAQSVDLTFQSSGSITQVLVQEG